jgi:hypothetical protein
MGRKRRALVQMKQMGVTFEPPFTGEPLGQLSQWDKPQRHSACLSNRLRWQSDSLSMKASHGVAVTPSCFWITPLTRKWPGRWEWDKGKAPAILYAN